MPPEPPAVVDAEWNLDFDHLAITFDKPLVDQPTAITNYRLFMGIFGIAQPTGALVVLPDAVELMFSSPVGTQGESIQYLATPADLVGANGLAVEPFDWPLV